MMAENKSAVVDCRFMLNQSDCKTLLNFNAAIRFSRGSCLSGEGIYDGYTTPS